jgi:molecular chaperone DnaK (HSP70)
VIGVDFGTSTSLIAQSSAVRTSVMPIGRIDRWVPSIAGLGIAEGFGYSSV